MSDQPIKPEMALAALLGRNPEPEEVSHFYKIKDTLGLADHDVVWTFLLAIGHYEMLYKQLPDQITASIAEALAKIRLEADGIGQAAERHLCKQVEANVADTIKKLSDAVILTGQQLATSNYRRYIGIVLGLSIGLATILLGSALYVGYSIEKHTNDSELMWLHTSQGQAAKTLARLNDVEGMLSCPTPLQTIKKPQGTYCLPYDKSTNQVRSWRITE